MIEGEFQVLADAYMGVAMNGRDRMRAGNRHPVFEPHDVFRCRGEDAWVAVAVETETQWRSLCAVMGRPDLSAEPALASPDGRRDARRRVAAAISRWTQLRTHYEAQTTLQAAGVPAGAVLNALELLRDPHVLHRHGFEFVDTQGVGPTPYPRVAFLLSDTPVPVSGPAPGFGEANEYVLGGLLGLTPNEIHDLRLAGVVANEPATIGGH
jgi:crotonobetainyl-CoA:carnitine CoA-transferase CaiB-like acyl-CoA transferase